MLMHRKACLILIKTNDKMMGKKTFTIYFQNVFFSWPTFQDFRKGMNSYLTKYKYGNTFTEDLWEELGKASGKPVATVMTAWTKEMGFPVIKVQ